MTFQDVGATRIEWFPLVDAAQAASWRLNPDVWESELTEHGYVQGSRRESNIDFPPSVVREEIWEFQDTASALAVQEFAVRNACGAASESFRLPGVTAAFGTRLVFDTYSLDQVSFVVDSRRYLILYQTLEPPSDHAFITNYSLRAIAVAMNRKQPEEMWCWPGGSYRSTPTPLPTESASGHSPADG